MASFKELEPYLNDRRVNAYLNMLMDAEGTSKYANPYATAGGGKIVLNDLSKSGGFPKWGFTQTDGKKNTSSAAGAFQFLNSTYDDLRRQGYEVNDFQPRTQRLAAIALLKQNGALPHIVNGDFNTAIKKSAGTWASLPGSPYAQKTRDTKFVQQSLQKHLNDPSLTLNNFEQYATTSTPPQGQTVDTTQQQTVENPYADLYNRQSQRESQNDQAEQWGLAERQQSLANSQALYNSIVDPDLRRLLNSQNQQTNVWGI